MPSRVMHLFGRTTRFPVIVGVGLTIARGAYAQSYTFTKFVGSGGGPGYADGTGPDARFAYPMGVAADVAGNVYVADTSNSVIRRITPRGEVSTLAGLAPLTGSTDGEGGTARFSRPRGVAIDGGGNVYVSDTNNHTIRRITATGVVTTLAGQPSVSGSADGTRSAARFCEPRGVAVDALGNVYVADSRNHAIRKITSDGMVTTMAGRAGTSESADGTGAAARFNRPGGVATEGSGNIYVADTNNNTIRKISPAGVVTTLAGNPEFAGTGDGTGRGLLLGDGGKELVVAAEQGTIKRSDRIEAIALPGP